MTLFYLYINLHGVLQENMTKYISPFTAHSNVVDINVKIKCGYQAKISTFVVYGLFYRS